MTELRRLQRLHKMQKAYSAQQKRRIKRIELIKKIEFHQNGMTKFLEGNQGYQIHLECINRLLNS